MNRLLGLILFFIGIGMVIGILVTESLLVFMVGAVNESSRDWLKP